MNTEYHCHNSSSLLKDIAVFSVTVAICSFFFFVAGILSQSAESMADTMVELAMPQPPETLELLPESLVFVPEPMCITPEIELALLDARSFESISVVPDRLPPKKKIPFHGIIVQAAGRYQVDPHLIRAIIFAESGYNPKAKSKKGARGLMQLMPSTAKSLGVQDIFDPAQNIDGGVRYFKSLLDRFNGDVQLALAAYNAGSRHVRNYEGIPPFKATKRYIKKVLKFRKKFKMESPSAARRLA